VHLGRQSNAWSIWGTGQPLERRLKDRRVAFDQLDGIVTFWKFGNQIENLIEESFEKEQKKKLGSTGAQNIVLLIWGKKVVLWGATWFLNSAGEAPESTTRESALVLSRTWRTATTPIPKDFQRAGSFPSGHLELLYAIHIQIFPFFEVIQNVWHVRREEALRRRIAPWHGGVWFSVGPMEARRAQAMRATSQSLPRLLPTTFSPANQRWQRFYENAGAVRAPIVTAICIPPWHQLEACSKQWR
jgi:hypothetical protein